MILTLPFVLLLLISGRCAAGRRPSPAGNRGGWCGKSFPSSSVPAAVAMVVDGADKEQER